MAAAAIWRKYGLEEECHRFIGDGATNLHGYANGEGRRVVSATSVFSTDAYKIPTGANAKVFELYPKLSELSKESCYISEAILERMASEISDRRIYEPVKVIVDRKPWVEPFTVASPVVQHKPVEIETSHSTERLSYKPLEQAPKGFVGGYSSKSEYTPLQSADRVVPKPTYGPISNGNIFDGESHRSRMFPPSTRHDIHTYTPMNAKKDNFNFQREFLSAFKPDDDTKNDYGALDTPVVDMDARKIPSSNAETLVSPFPWERNLEAQRMVQPTFTPQNRIPEASEYRYPSYISRGFSKAPSVAERRSFNVMEEPMHMFDASRPIRDFNPKSPIRSIMRDSTHSYGYRNVRSTPTAMYHNFI
ncbi:hypothetical protein BgAZ_104510 [Babesia gibsoni]|uniref:Uncharacterized protein n=1 Tax=Babesia gibsoni TaxID=33632 RepID=A0AAD8PG02_BABGI|nr:hypothetical protein BgAZ_104510 [Babesia gibsoni]